MRIGLPSTSTTACRFCEFEIHSLVQVRDHEDACILDYDRNIGTKRRYKGVCIVDNSEVHRLVILVE